MEHPVVLILGAGVHQVDAVRAAQRLGCEVWTVDYSAESPAHRVADHFWVRSTQEADALRTDWEATGRAFPNGVLAPCTDVGLLALAELVEAWGVVGPGRELVKLVCDKRNFRSWQRAHGLEHPRFALEAGDFLSGGTPAWLAKPSRCSGTRGVTWGLGTDGLLHAWEQAAKASLDGCALVEEWLEGEQLTAEGFWQEGKLAWWELTDRLIPGPDRPLTQGHVFPSTVPDAARVAVQEELENTMRLLPFAGGFFDADVVWSGGRAVILEWTPRLGGNRLTKLWQRLGGPDVAEEAVRHALGWTVEPMKWPHPQPGFVEILGGSRAGRLLYDEERVPEAADWVRGLLEVGIDASPGAMVPPWLDGRSALGYIIGSATANEPPRRQIVQETLDFLEWRVE
jgi:biotin carboxylase